MADPIIAKEKLGYLPESAPLYADMTVGSGSSSFIAELRGFSGAEKSKAVDKALDTCFLDPVRQPEHRYALQGLSPPHLPGAVGPCTIPDILILDEPTDGLDPNQKQEVRNLIKRMGEDKAIIFSTHILEEVEAACTRAIIIDQGKVVADGTPDELKGKSKGAGAITVRINGMAGSGIRQELESLGGVASVLETSASETAFAGQVLPSKSGAGLSESIFNLCKDRGLVLEEMRVEEGRLDEVFRQLTVADTLLAKKSLKESDSAAA